MTTLQWGNSPVGTYTAPVFLGIARRMFGPPDLRIETTENLTGADYTEAVVAGRFDMGHIGTPPLFAALARTEEYVIVGQAIMRSPCFYLVAAPGITSVRQLKGKTVALNKLRTCPHSIVRTLLRREGMREDDVTLATLVEGARINEAIGRGDVAAAVNWEPYVSQAERAFGWHLLADGREVIDPSNYGYMLYARRPLVAEQPALVRAVVAGYAASVRYAAEHLTEAAETLYGRLPSVAPEDIDRALRRDAVSWNWDPRIDPDFLDRVLAELKAQEVIPPDFDVTRFVVRLELPPVATEGYLSSKP